MEIWDGTFDMPGRTPVHIPPLHVPLRTVTSSGRNLVLAPTDPIATAAVHEHRRSPLPQGRRRTTSTKVMVRAIALGILTTLLSHAVPWMTGLPLSTTFTRIASMAANLFAIVAMFAFMKATLQSALPSEAEHETPAAVLSDVCQRIRGAHRKYRPCDDDLHTALVEATHRCCRIVNVAGDSTDLQVVETVALVKGRLPTLLAAYERTQAVGDPRELCAAVDRMAEAVLMVGDQAEIARRRLLALATDGLETEVRYLSARTGRDEHRLSSILAPVN